MRQTKEISLLKQAVGGINHRLDYLENREKEIFDEIRDKLKTDQSPTKIPLQKSVSHSRKDSLESEKVSESLKSKNQIPTKSVKTQSGTQTLPKSKPKATHLEPPSFTRPVKLESQTKRRKQNFFKVSGVDDMICNMIDSSGS